MSTVQEFGTQTATAEKVNTSQGQTTRVNATEVQTVVVNEVPSWIVLLLVVGWLMPSPNEIGRTVRGWLQAKKHLKQYSLRAVADWLSHESGRSISYSGLRSRIKLEEYRKREAANQRFLAQRYKEALEKAERLEKQRICGASVRIPKDVGGTTP